MPEIYVFEDNGPEDGLVEKGMLITPSSTLLLNSCNGHTMRFLNGSTHTLDKLKRIMQRDGTETYYIVFYDVSPNNINTVNGYRDLVIRCKSFKNVYILPIICIEYFLVHMLRDMKVLQCGVKLEPFIHYLVDEFDWNKFLSEYREGEFLFTYKENLKNKKLPGAIRSLEKSYKYILEKQLYVCLNNHNSESRNNCGWFYKNDCNCEGCSFSQKYTKAYKAERLVSSLPIFTIISREHKMLLKCYGIDTEPVSLDKAVHKQADFYKRLSENMGFTNIFSADVIDTPDIKL